MTKESLEKELIKQTARADALQEALEIQAKHRAPVIVNPYPYPKVIDWQYRPQWHQCWTITCGSSGTGWSNSCGTTANLRIAKTLGRSGIGEAILTYPPISPNRLSMLD